MVVLFVWDFCLSPEADLFFLSHFAPVHLLLLPPKPLPLVLSDNQS